MKLALVGPYPLDPDRIPGGVAAVTYYLAAGLAKYPDINLHVIAAAKQNSRDLVVEHDGFTVHHLAYPKTRLMPNQLRDIGRYRQALEALAPDIVHSQTPAGADAAAQSGFTTVLTIHGIPEQERKFARGLSNRLGAALAPWLTRRAIRRAHAGIAISPYVIDAYRHVAPIPWHSIPNPIEDRFFEVKGRDKPGKLLFAGVMYKRKNIPGLLRAFQRVRAASQTAELFITGKVLDPGILEWAKAYVAANNLSSSVHLLGFVSQDELAAHFAEASIICMFSEEETAPMIIAQAMCAGKPVISTAAGGVPYMVVDGETGFVVPVGDEASFAERALTLLRDESRRRDMGLRARARAEQMYRTGAVVEQTVAVYRSLLGEARR